MSRKKYSPVQEGEWVYPRRRNYRMACCDCHLVHRLDFKLVECLNGGKKIKFRAFRDNRATAQLRRKRKKK